MTQPFVRSPQLLSPSRCRLLVVDMQERFAALIPNWDALVSRIRLLLDAARLLDVPAETTEQYPEGLGATVAELRDCFPAPIPDKLRFSSIEAINLVSPRDGDRDTMILCGIETHVCVLQSAFDAASKGFAVHLVVDAVASRHAIDREVAIDRMRDAGITVTTAESLLFEWCETASNSEFKALSALVKAAEQDR